jgi:hypothetical protein
VNVEIKEQSKQWTNTHSPNKPKKFKQTLSVFWNRKGVLMAEFMQRTTIMSYVYCKTLKKLCRAIWNKRRGMLTYGVVFVHDNARLYTAPCTRALLGYFDWELFHHPPHSPELTPSDCHLFTYLKNWLWSQRFNSNKELMEGVKTRLSSQAADFFDTGI